MKIEKKQKDTICFLTQKLESMSEKWAVTGSFGQVLQGVNVVPKDIDIISTRVGVRKIQSILKEFTQHKVSYSATNSMRSYFGVIEINSCKIEFFGEIENLLKNNTWEPHIEWEKNITEIVIDSIVVPVITLEYELLICNKLFITERAILIEKRLSSQSQIRTIQTPIAMYKLEFTLKQHTPLIHFQHDQAGATLRATEVKPKLDKFIIEKLGGIEKVKKEHPDWLVGNGEHAALDYKFRIERSNGKIEGIKLQFFEDYKEEDLKKRWKMKGNYPMLLANMGGKPSVSELKDIIQFQTIECLIFSFCESLVKEIKDIICLFFATCNFGNRNNKGFGSFSIIKINNVDLNWDENKLLPQTFFLQVDTCKTKAIFECIDFFYKWLKSGINFTSHKDRDGNWCCDKLRYKKSLLFEYLDSIRTSVPPKYSWEKRWLKENYFTLPSLANNPKFARAILGLADKTTFTRAKCNRSGTDVPYDQNNKVVYNAHLGLEVDRIKSPITFKPVIIGSLTKIYIHINKENIDYLYANVSEKRFLFSEREKIDIQYRIGNNQYTFSYHLGEDPGKFDVHINRLASSHLDDNLKALLEDLINFRKSINALAIPDLIFDYDAFLSFVRKAHPTFTAKNFQWNDIVNTPIQILKTK